jgi:hypothetical protein
MIVFKNILNPKSLKTIMHGIVIVVKKILVLKEQLKLIRYLQF